MGKAWTKKSNKVPVDELQNSSLASFYNASELLADADLLYENQRYSRSVALSILSEEQENRVREQ